MKFIRMSVWWPIAVVALLVTQTANAFYNPQTGRWLNRDPMEEPIRDPDSSEEAGAINLYVLLRNDGVSATDYLGLKPNCCPNPKPINVTVTSEDSIKASRGYRLPRNANVGQMLTHIYSKVQQGECIKRLTIAAHGRTEILEIGGKDPKSSPPPDRRGRVNRETYISEQNANRIGQSIANLVCLCKPCEIYILTCHVGLGTIPRELAKGSGCTVWAPNGFCCPNYTNPERSRVRPRSPEYPDYIPTGSGDCFVRFDP